MEDTQESHTTESEYDTKRRLSFVEDQEIVRSLMHRTILIEPMRTFINRIKFDANQLTVEEELDMLSIVVSCIDLTTLSGDDTATNVERLCYRAIHPLDEDLASEYKDLTCRAVCVYPARIQDCVKTFKRLGSGQKVKIAAVATGFPSGQYGLKSRLIEIKEAVENGANEIDVVINRPLALCANWTAVYDELCEMRSCCDIGKGSNDSEVHLKVIIGAGDLLTSSPSTIYGASLVSILAGADFIKTSTGKESVNATLPIGYIMMRAIIDYYDHTGIRIGFKPAGGIRTYKDALNWLMLAKRMLGSDWLNHKLFRFGASGLLDDVEKRIIHLLSQKIDS